jgi:hypothetical protein
MQYSGGSREHSIQLADILLHWVQQHLQEAAAAAAAANNAQGC